MCIWMQMTTEAKGIDLPVTGSCELADVDARNQQEQYKHHL